MSSCKNIETEVHVTVTTPFGGRTYGFFTTKGGKDVYVDLNQMNRDGFEAAAMQSGVPAVIDIEKKPDGKLRVSKVHQINGKEGGEPVPSEKKAKAKRKRPKKTHKVGARGKGEIITLKKGYGFIAVKGYNNIFFCFTHVDDLDLIEVGVEVEFDVVDSDRDSGVIAKGVVVPASREGLEKLVKTLGSVEPQQRAA